MIAGLGPMQCVNAACPPERSARPFLRHSSRDAWLVAAVCAHAATSALAFAELAPRGLAGSAAAAVGFGASLCWVANTASHNHIHNPLFRARVVNRGFSLLLTVVLGFPQSAWRARHLFHHAGEPAGKEPRLATPRALFEASLVLCSWLAFACLAPGVFLLSYVPGYLFGLLLCDVQGRMEHRSGAHPERGISYYGRLHNLLWFNDGHHAEHHRFPAEHWRRLPLRRSEVVARTSSVPPHLRFLAAGEGRPVSWAGVLLGGLERVALGSVVIQRILVRKHEAAFRALLADVPGVHRVMVIGGGLFPRTLLVLKRLFPACEIVVVDQSAGNVACARRYLRARGREWLGDLVSEDGEVRGVTFRVERFSAERDHDLDLVVCPLAYVGDRAELGRANARLGVLSHVWLWQRHAPGAVISGWLMKRLELSSGAP